MEGGPESLSRRRSRAEVEQAVLESLVTMLNGSSFKDVTVDELARAAGISRTAFYFYYRGKNQVLMAAAEGASAAAYAEADRWWHGEGPPDELVRLALEGIAGVWMTHGDILRAAVEATTYDDEFKVFYTALVQRFVTATADHLRRELEAGRLRPLEPQAVAEALVWMAERCNYAFLVLEGRPVRDVVDALTDIWVHALYPDG
jgi:TetR/AcrR family transcriptional regulator, ethionamide resistance regulator